MQVVAVQVMDAPVLLLGGLIGGSIYSGSTDTVISVLLGRSVNTATFDAEPIAVAATSCVTGCPLGTELTWKTVA